MGHGQQAQAERRVGDDALLSARAYPLLGSRLLSRVLRKMLNALSLIALGKMAADTAFALRHLEKE